VKIVQVAFWWMAVIAVAITCQPAHGFYFVDWPAGPKVPPTLLPPGSNQPGNPPDRNFQPPGVTKPPGGGPGDETPATPEPSTASLAALGIGLAVVYRFRHRGLPKELRQG